MCWWERCEVWFGHDARRDNPWMNVFIYMISGAKVRAPATAMALIERIKG